MKLKEFDSILNEALVKETRRIIVEQVEKLDQLVDVVKNLESLSGLSDKIQSIDPMGSGVKIVIQGLTPEELVKCCGGDSLGSTQTRLMQGIHHDLEESGMGSSHDIDINIDGDDETLGLTITISPNDDELSTEKETDMNEVTDNGELTNTFGQSLYENPKDENPNVKKKKNMILGDEKINENHKSGKKEQMDFICKHDKKCKREDLMKLSDKEVEIKYIALEKKMGMNESKKKVITLSESGLEKLIERIIVEAGVESPSANFPTGGVPGLEVTKKNRNDSGKENDDALKAVEKKIRDFLSFEGNDDPKFPNQVGKGEQKVATKNTDSENDVVDLNRGRTSADLTYDQEPSEQFKERAKLSLVGASEMGNSQDAANVIPSKTGENILKTSEKRKEARANEPIYNKEAVPVHEDPSKKDRSGPKSGNAGDAVASEILRMKQMSEYKEKTQ